MFASRQVACILVRVEIEVSLCEAIFVHVLFMARGFPRLVQYLWLSHSGRGADGRATCASLGLTASARTSRLLGNGRLPLPTAPAQALHLDIVGHGRLEANHVVHAAGLGPVLFGSLNKLVEPLLHPRVDLTPVRLVVEGVLLLLLLIVALGVGRCDRARVVVPRVVQVDPGGRPRTAQRT